MIASLMTFHSKDDLSTEDHRIVAALLKRVPPYLLDDCRQAAYLGLLKAYASGSNKKNFYGYARACARNEIIEEMARLHGGGGGVVSLSKDIYIDYHKYRNGDSSVAGDRRAFAFDVLIRATRKDSDNI